MAGEGDVVPNFIQEAPRAQIRLLECHNDAGGHRNLSRVLRPLNCIFIQYFVLLVISFSDAFGKSVMEIACLISSLLLIPYQRLVSA